MVIATDKIDPQPVLPALEEPDCSAEEALEHGNYPLAYAIAQSDETKICAEIMCGAIGAGLKKFDSLADVSAEARLIQAYGLWCRKEDRASSDIAAGLDLKAAGELRQIVAHGADVLIFTMPNADYSAYEGFDDFRVQIIAMEPNTFGLTMTELLAQLPSNFKPDLLLSLGAFGPYLPGGFHQAGIPTAFWVGDHDYFYGTRHGDLSQADIIIVNSAGEHQEISSLYDNRVAAFPGHEGYGRSADYPEDMGDRDFDILFTGRAFTPYMRDKAQFLFRLATLESDSANIQIRDGYLEEDDYVEALARAKHVPLYWRYAGGVQTRAIDALRQNTAVLSPENPLCAPLLGGEAGGFLSLYGTEPEQKAMSYIDGYDQLSVHRTDHRQNFVNLFLPSPEREKRFLKFCLLQTLLCKDHQKPEARSSATPVELRGYDVEHGVSVYTSIMKRNTEAADKTAVHLNNAMAAIFYAAILVQNNQRLGELALELGQVGTESFPDCLALRFNAARAFWTFGQRDVAVDHFSYLVDHFDDLAFDPRLDALFSHRVRPLADMFSYGDFYAKVISDQQMGSDTARRMILSGALTYLGLAAFEGGDLNEARNCYGRAIGLSQLNFPAHRLNAQAQCEAKDSAKDILSSFYRAVNLYPPLIDDLLEVGLKSEMAENNEKAAQEILRHWVLYQARVRQADGNYRPLNQSVLATVKENRYLMSDWIAGLFDELLGGVTQ